MNALDINVVTHEIRTIIVNEDGTVTHEVVQRDQPLDHSATHELILDHQWVLVREERDLKLAACDWVATRAFEVGEPVPTEWRDYRQALRDVTQQANPFFVVWPTAPASPQGLTPTRNVIRAEPGSDLNAAGAEIL